MILYADETLFLLFSTWCLCYSCFLSISRVNFGGFFILIFSAFTNVFVALSVFDDSTFRISSIHVVYAESFLLPWLGDWVTCFWVILSIVEPPLPVNVAVMSWVMVVVGWSEPIVIPNFDGVVRLCNASLVISLQSWAAWLAIPLILVILVVMVVLIMRWVVYLILVVLAGIGLDPDPGVGCVVTGVVLFCIDLGCTGLIPSIGSNLGRLAYVDHHIDVGVVFIIDLDVVLGLVLTLGGVMMAWRWCWCCGLNHHMCGIDILLQPSHSHFGTFRVGYIAVGYFWLGGRVHNKF